MVVLNTFKLTCCQRPMPEIPTLGWQRQEDYKFEISLSYIMRSLQKRIKPKSSKKKILKLHAYEANEIFGISLYCRYSYCYFAMHGSHLISPIVYSVHKYGLYYVMCSVCLFLGIGAMAWQLRALNTFAENLGSVPRAYMMAHNSF